MTYYNEQHPSNTTPLYFGDQYPLYFDERKFSQQPTSNPWQADEDSTAACNQHR